MLGYGLDDIEFTVKQWNDFVHPDDLPMAWKSINDHIEGRTPVHSLEYRMRTKDGGYKWVLDQAQAVECDEDGSVVRMSGIHEDITERKLSEDKIKSLLAEKELLLKETHHRIKNYMTSIRGLLSLQATSQEDSPASSVLFDAISRVQSMALLYDKLFNSRDFTKISVIDYIPSLVDEIKENFPNSSSVKFEKIIDDFVLDSKKMQPLGIIINELITNIMKYAFTGRDNGSITISANLTGNRVFIVIADNGIGIPESITFENSTGFGMQLVSMLTQQIGGSIKIERGDGTSFVLEFDV